jgi:hypothetical protein
MTPHNPWHEVGRRAECGKSACSVRTGGSWKRNHGAPYTGTKPETADTAKGTPTDTAPALDPTNANAPFRHVRASYRDFTMLNDTYMTLVNGFNTNGAANEFSYVGTISYNGEDFIKHDGSLTIGALMYEDYLASLE